MRSQEAELEEKAAGVLFVSGVKLLSQGEGKRALRRFERAAETYRERGLRRGVAECFREMGNVYAFYEEWDKAEECYLKAAELERASKNWAGLLENLFLLSYLQLDKNDLDRAFEYAVEAEKVSKKSGDKTGQFQVYRHMGRIYERKWDLKRARERLEKAIKIGERLGLPETREVAREIVWILEKEAETEIRRKNRR
ncbi:MAG: tetratricopeptide repeat protein [Candidatus Freyarchaeota archaeon]